MAARLPERSDPSSPFAVEDGTFRVLVWLRLVVTVNTLVLAVLRWDGVERPVAGVVALGTLVLWSAFVSWAYAAARRRTAVLLLADLTVSMGLLLSTPVVKGDDWGATLPGFWVMTVVLVWAARWGGWGGLVAAVVVSATDLGMRYPDIDETNYGNVFLLLIGGPIVGRLVSALKTLAAQRDAAQRAAALAEERARLARVVHDGVLQVLALVQRRGADLGPEGAELGRLAGEQEARLRALVQARSGSAALAQEEAGPEQLDLSAAVGELATRRTPRVEVATPAHPVLLPAGVVTELVAAAGACLDNVAMHVGEQAQAWVFLEELPDQVVLSVRDEGPGVPEGRLDAAAAEGRLGVSQSIRGRMSDLGGSASCHTGAGGTEWELAVPRPA